jgi:dihydrolipoamide dehydrogenase
VEFATFLAELGVKVTLIEMMGKILPLEDEDASTLLKQELTRLGVTIHTSAKLQRIHETADSVQIVATRQGQDFHLTSAYALICTGRRPRLHVEELNRLGIRHNPKGIFVNEDLMTNIRDIYAIGDVTGGIMLAHRAMQQGKALASTLFGGRAIVYQEEAVPAVIYSHPQVARVGLTEKQARQQGLELEVKKTDFAANIIARIELMGQGFVKSLFHKDHLVGVTIVGERAADLITPMSLAVANGLGKRELSRWIIPHPSLSEVMTTSS